MNQLQSLKSELKSLASPEKAKLLQRYFKTGKGQYGEGDIFLGVTVPEIRAIAKKYKDLPLEEIKSLLTSKIHEERLTALLLLVHLYQKNPDKKFVDLYLSNTKYINNWDLVDLTSHKILGHYLENKPRDILYNLAKSTSLWERRISIISTFYFIPKKDFKDALALAEILLHDKHDLMHKAVGWVLREIGKKDLPTLQIFLKKYYKTMPRTMLRYAIEKFPEEERKKYLRGEI
ncbi:MAG: DNA alkylation repair protein [archaeon]